MRILYIEQSIPPYLGGIERVSWINAQSFIEAGCEVFFAYSLQDSDEVDKNHKYKLDYSLGIDEFVKSLYSFVVKSKIDVIINQDIYEKRIRKTFELLKNNNVCKIVHCFHLSPEYLDYARGQHKSLKHKLKDIYLCFAEGLDALSYEKKCMYQLVDAFVLLSESFKDSFAKRFKLIDTDKLYAISNPLAFETSIQEEDLKNKKKKVLIVTRFFEIQKNICSALRIWQKIERDGYDAWELIIAGYGQDEEFIKNYAKELNIKRVSFVGKVSGPQELYKEASIFMMTSNYEGFGMTLTEASQFGCIPIAFDNFTVLHDIIVNNKNGFIIQSKNEEQYKDVMTQLMDNTELRARISKNAIQESQCFSRSNICKQWLSLLKKICGSFEN